MARERRESEAHACSLSTKTSLEDEIEKNVASVSALEDETVELRRRADALREAASESERTHEAATCRLRAETELEMVEQRKRADWLRDELEEIKAKQKEYESSSSGGDSDEIDCFRPS